MKEHKRAVFHGDTNAWEKWTWNSLGECEHPWSQWTIPRLYLESWYIQQQNNVMNRESGILPHMYKSLMTYLCFIVICSFHSMLLSLYLSLHLPSSHSDDGTCIGTEVLVNKVFVSTSEEPNKRWMVQSLVTQDYINVKTTWKTVCSCIYSISGHVNAHTGSYLLHKEIISIS